MLFICLLYVLFVTLTFCGVEGFFFGSMILTVMTSALLGYGVTVGLCVYPFVFLGFAYIVDRINGKI